MTSAKILYPDINPNNFYGPGDYSPILEDLGEIILQHDDHDYQGDSFVLYTRNVDGYDQYGILIFGWGSCSGCDALQACDSYNEIDSLRNSLESSIQWDSLKNTLRYLDEHDWAGDYTWGSSECRNFVLAAKKLLREKLID